MTPMWVLPETADIGGILYTLNTDFRDVLEIIMYLQNEPDEMLAVSIALALFYNEFDDMPAGDWQEAWNYLSSFISCFEEESGPSRPQTFDWQQDYNAIVSDINKVVGLEIRSVPELHWFTFISYFNGIGEGQLSTLVSLREKKRKGEKLTEWEKDFYRYNKNRVNLKKNHTPEEQAEIDMWNELEMSKTQSPNYAIPSSKSKKTKQAKKE